jgi:hypothetical protein
LTNVTPSKPFCVRIASLAMPRLATSITDATAARLLYVYGPPENLAVGDRPGLPVASLTVSPNPSPAGITRITWAGGAHTPNAAVDIMDTEGRRVRRLPLDATGSARWDGRDERGLTVRAGIHFVRPVGEGAGAGTGVRLVVIR